MTRLDAATNKYRNKRTVVDGLVFDSAKEAARYQDLRLLERAGVIRELRRQVPFWLHTRGPNGGSITLGRYVADFVYVDAVSGRQVVEDVKSAATAKLAIYRWKRAHVHAEYGIEIQEVGV